MTSSFVKLEYDREYRRKNRDRFNEYHKEYQQKLREFDPDYFVKKIFRERKRQSRNQGIPFTITLDEIRNVPEFCPILGLKLTAGGGINEPTTASLDKIIPELGYVSGNVHWISWRANRIKNNASQEEIAKLHEWFQIFTSH